VLFPSGFFLTFLLPAILIGYWLAPKSFRNPLLLLASLFFYAWGEPVFVFVLLGMTIVNYGLARILDAAPQRKKWLVVYITLNILFLVAFKYANFLAGTFAALIGETASFEENWETIPLPLGISFYAFHAITYGVDVYRRTNPPQKRIDHFALYLFLFPHQIAGPIVTYQSIAAEIEDRNPEINIIVKGMYRFAIGLGKKVILSNGLILLVDACNEQQLLGGNTSTLAWIEMLAYTFYIYYDFSGYSDMAIGLGLMFGFHFPENFNRPYTARSITEFWKRWHMSLGYFMQHYLYIPLGGNRVAKGRLYFNLFLVFFLSGLWHGAAWNFIIWGMYHGAWLVIERLFLKKWLDRSGILSAIWTFLLVLSGWVFFHEANLTEALSTFKYLFSFRFEALPVMRDAFYFAALLLICTFLILLEYQRSLTALRLKWTNSESTVVACSRFAWMALLYTISYSYVAAGSYNPFIYFNF